MKIFHALVGYLTVTALPFHPFAFASPLTASSIHYDGYVDIDTTQNHIDDALMKQFLGTIAETCQRVTAQNYSDSLSALEKDDVPGNILEARQLPPVVVAIPTVGFILFLVADITLSIIWIKSDDPVRGKDIEFLVEHFY